MRDRERQTDRDNGRDRQVDWERVERQTLKQNNKIIKINKRSQLSSRTHKHKWNRNRRITGTLHTSQQQLQAMH